METATARPLPPRDVLTLYDLSERLLDVEAFIHDNEQAIIDAGGDLDAVPGLVELLDGIQGRFVDKVEHLVLFIQNRSAIAKTRKETADQFKRMADVDTKVVDSLKAYLVRCQRRANWTKVETAKCRATIVKNSQVSVDRPVDLIGLGVIHALACVECYGNQHISETQVTDDQITNNNPFNAWRDPDDPEGVEHFAAEVLGMIVEERRPVYSLNRDRILGKWHEAYAKAVDELVAEAEMKTPGAKLSPFDLDQQAHHRANQDPVLRLLGVTVTQGYHVRVK